VTSIKDVFLTEPNSHLSLGEMAPSAGFRNCASFEGSDKRRRTSLTQRHCMPYFTTSEIYTGKCRLFCKLCLI